MPQYGRISAGRRTGSSPSGYNRRGSSNQRPSWVTGRSGSRNPQYATSRNMAWAPGFGTNQSNSRYPNKIHVGGRHNNTYYRGADNKYTQQPSWGGHTQQRGWGGQGGPPGGWPQQWPVQRQQLQPWDEFNQQYSDWHQRSGFQQYGGEHGWAKFGGNSPRQAVAGEWGDPRWQWNKINEAWNQAAPSGYTRHWNPIWQQWNYRPRQDTRNQQQYQQFATKMGLSLGMQESPTPETFPQPGPNVTKTLGESMGQSYSPQAARARGGAGNQFDGTRWEDRGYERRSQRPDPSKGEYGFKIPGTDDWYVGTRPQDPGGGGGGGGEQGPPMDEPLPGEKPPTGPQDGTRVCGTCGGTGRV